MSDQTMPLIEQRGLAAEEDFGIDTLAKRLREETTDSHGEVARFSGVVSAWACTISWAVRACAGVP